MSASDHTSWHTPGSTAGKMTNSSNSESDQDVVSRLSSQVAEIRQGVLTYYVHGERLIVKDMALDSTDTSLSSDSRGYLFVTFDCEADQFVHIFPPNMTKDYWDLRSLSWLKSETLFRSPYDFYMSHYMLASDPSAALPTIDHIPESLKVDYPLDFSHTTTPILKTHPLFHDKNFPDIPHHGLERIILDFDAPEYFSLFRVRVPPFDDITVHKDQHLVGAASLLQHCKELTLIFDEAYRSVHPWYNLTEDQWDPDTTQRMHVCEMGLIVDWIFEYAWANEYLQHIPKITIKGNVQAGVREKWETIFKEWNTAKAKSHVEWQYIYKPNIQAIETRGKIPGLLWLPETEFPPACNCTAPCSDLGPTAQAWEPAQFTSWDQYEKFEGDTAEWENRPPGNVPIAWT